MIAHLSGALFLKTPQTVIVEAGGIGYEISVPLSTFYALPERNERISLHIYTHVREDALSLFGFFTKLEKDLFLMLITVSGIGPKLALNVLSGIGPQDLCEAIACGDSARLQAIPGVGRKTADRIALELKDRAAQFLGNREGFSPPQVPAGGMEEITEDALSALQNLGYPAKIARQAIEKARFSLDETNLEGLIKEALKILA